MTKEEPLHVVVKTSSYVIVGSPLAEVRTVLQTLGPTRSGSAFSACTDWSVDWRFDVKAGMPLARVINPRV